MSSTNLGTRELSAINKLGDILIPGDEKYPSFSKLGCSEHMGEMTPHMPEKDLNDLKGLLVAFSFLPGFFLSGLLAYLEWAFNKGIWLPGPLRMIRFGVRGLVMSLYWSGFKGKNYPGPSPLEIMDYKVGVFLD